MSSLRPANFPWLLLTVLMCTPAAADDRRAERHELVRQTIASPRDGRPAVDDRRVLRAMRRVKRHLFVPEPWRESAYEDRPLPIGHEQTISQPYIVAFMTELLELDADDSVLEIGTGSGYQTAVLAEIARDVCSVEIVPELAAQARTTLRELGYQNVKVRAGDGYAGWPDQAPFDKILVTAAPDHVPQPLVDQLRPGGRLVLPVGPDSWSGQELVVLTKTPEGEIERESVMAVRFVPFTGEGVRKNGN